MPKVIYTPEADEDIRDIFRYIAREQERPSVAAKNIQELEKKCNEYGEAFSKGSEIGTARPDLGSAYRTFAFKRWVVIFRPTGGGIEVLRVLDGARDYPALFDS